MASIADTRSLSELSIPGTHDSGARFEPYPGIAKTQNLTIADQLAGGIRFFDMRCRNFDDQFLIYHGPIDQNQTFDEVLATMSGFLTAHPGEAVIMSVKEEVMSQGATMTFEQVFDGYVASSPSRWYLEPSVPLLGDVRGQIVLLRRFDATATPLGIDASPWADNATFTIANGAATLRIEDNYDLMDNDSKWSDITALLDEAQNGDPATLFLTYTSGFQTVNGLNDITIVSDDINQRLDRWLADPANRHAHTGVVPMDFVTASRARSVIATN
jgi:1-phosphatidylinositol phosphodiesterase